MTFCLLGPGQDLRNKVLLGKAAAAKPGEDRSQSPGEKNTFSRAEGGFRKCGPCPLASVSLAEIVHGPSNLPVDVGGWQWGDLPCVFSGDFVTPSPARGPHAPGKAKCLFVPSGLHGNRPDSVNPCFPCFKQTRFTRISGITTTTTTTVKMLLCLSPVH